VLLCSFSLINLIFSSLLFTPQYNFDKKNFMKTWNQNNNLDQTPSWDPKIERKKCGMKLLSSPLSITVFFRCRNKLWRGSGVASMWDFHHFFAFPLRFSSDCCFLSYFRTFLWSFFRFLAVVGFLCFGVLLLWTFWCSWFVLVLVAVVCSFTIVCPWPFLANLDTTVTRRWSPRNLENPLDKPYRTTFIIGPFEYPWKCLFLCLF